MKSVEFKKYKSLKYKLNSLKAVKENINEICFTDKLPSFEDLTKICDYFPSLNTLRFFKVFRDASNSYLTPKDEMVDYMNTSEDEPVDERQSKLDLLKSRMQMANEVRAKIKTLKIESVCRDPDFALIYLCNQFRAVQNLSLERFSNFNKDCKSTYTSIRFLKELKFLKIRDCKMNDKQFDYLTNYLKLVKIKEIDVSGNLLQSPQCLKSVLEIKKLKKFIIARNQLGIDQIKNILTYVKNCNNIRHIDLSSNGYANDHCKGIIEKELFQLLETNKLIEKIYLIDSAFEFVNVKKLYDSMLKIFDPRTYSNLKEFHISYYCDADKEKCVEDKFKIFEKFKEEKSNSELWKEYDINLTKESAPTGKQSAIKIEIVSKNVENRKINFSATKYFTNIHQEVVFKSFFELSKENQKINSSKENDSKVKMQSLKKQQRPKNNSKTRIRKRVKKEIEKSRNNSILNFR